jgi:methionyl-tRNA formyltransferase
VTQPDRARGRGQRVVPAPVKDFAVTHGIPLIQPERLRDPAVEASIRSWQPDLGVVAAYGRIIPPHLLAIPAHGMINVHASLLPKYRGAAPVQRAVIAGEPETGVTIMRVAEELDTGNMFAHATRPIGPDERSETIERDLAGRGARLLVEVVDAIATGTARETPQDHARSTYAPRLTREEGLIDWSLSATDIHNRVRGLSPWPHAYSFLDGQRLILTATQVAAERTDAPPGAIVRILPDRLLVATGGGGQIAVLEVQPEGRRAMAARDYLAGHSMAPGGRFSNQPRSSAL